MVGGPSRSPTPFATARRFSPSRSALWSYNDPNHRVAGVALLGICGVLLLAGFSINVPTMFGMEVGILDEAIGAVENVERIMSEEGLSPKEAARKAMD